MQDPSSPDLRRAHRHLCALALASLGVAGAQAAPPPLPANAPPMLRAYVEAQHRTAEQRAAVPWRRIDTTPPTVTAIDISGTIDAQKVGQTILAKLTLQDDLSGIANYDLFLRSPSGIQHIYRPQDVHSRLNKINTSQTIGIAQNTPGTNRFMEPGTWVAQSLGIADNAGNYANYGEDQLGALGKVNFEVVNDGPYDAVPPTLVSGHIDTPVVVLSKPPRGLPAGTPPYVVTTMSVADTGNGVVSGVYDVWAYFSLPDGSDGIWITANTDRAGAGANVVHPGYQLRADQTPGVYTIQYVDLLDYALNEAMLWDVQSLFDGATITVNP